MLLHAAVIVVVLAQFQTPAVRAQQPGLAVVTLALDTPPSPAAKPVHVAKPVPVPEPSVIPPVLPNPDSPQIVAQALPASAMAPGGCDLTDAVQAALRSDAAVRQQLAQMPRDQRSVANAVALWNQTWVNFADLPSQAALVPIRATVVRVVAAASDDCRSQAQAGPRLIYLPDASGQTTVLALGSGQWTWSQVAQTAQVQADVPPPEIRKVVG